jgi:ATP-dependent DNA ligase
MLNPARRPALSRHACPSPQENRRPGWIHEIKHDGFRILARKEARGMRLIIGRLRRAFWSDLISSAM